MWVPIPQWPVDHGCALARNCRLAMPSPRSAIRSTFTIVPSSARLDTMNSLPEVIECVECGGRCVLVTQFEDGYEPEPDEWVVYRCSVCLHRFDVVVGEVDDGDGA